MGSEMTADRGATIVFIDTSVPDYQQIANSVPAGDTVVLIDGSQDGVAQITDYLAKTSNVGAIHIVSHGSDGELDIGTSAVSGATLDRYADQIASWKAALAPGADLFLYGCSIAADGAGQQFVDQVAGLTGATVAASSDITGATASGGNWNLEFSTGAVASPTISDPGYGGILSHFRASSLTWQPISGTKVQFNMQVSFRESAWTSAGLYHTTTGGNLTHAPAVGDIINVSGKNPGVVNFGDNSTAQPYVKVIAVSTTQDYFVADLVDINGNPLTHTYAAAGSYTAFFQDSARLSTLQNFANDAYRSQTLVDAGANNSPPVSSLPPIIQVGAGQLNTFQIPATDPNGDRLSFSIGTAAQFDPDQRAATLIAPVGVTLSSSGLLTWDLSKSTVVKSGQQYVMTATISDYSAAGVLKSTTPLDFILQVVDTTTSKPPVFTIVPPAQTVFAGIAAPEVELVASDPQGGLFNVQALNPIAGMTTLYHGDEGELHVDITPTAAEIGTSSIVNFQAIDNLGLTAQTSVTYTVLSPAPTLEAVAGRVLGAGQSEVIGTATAAQAGDTLSVAVTSGGQDGTLSLVPTASGASTYNIVYTSKTGVPLTDSDVIGYTVTDATLAAQIVASTNVSASAKGSATVTLDTTIATPVVTAPAYANATNEGTLALTVTDADTDLASTAVTVSDGTNTVAATQNAVGQWIADVSSLSQGTLTATATATDKADNSATGTTTLVHDDRITAPVVTAPAYADKANEGTLTLTVADADTDLTSTAVTVSDGTNTVTATQNAAGLWVADVSSLSQGTLTATATATDEAGNSATGTTTLVHDDKIATPSVSFAASNSLVGAAEVNSAKASTAAYTVSGVDIDAAGSVTFSGTLKSTGVLGTVAGDGTNGSHTVDLSGFQDGTVTASVANTDKAGNTANGQSVSTTLDTTAPTITAVSDSGAGIDAAGNGDLGAGQTVALTVSSSETVFVQGGTPTLTLNDGGTATYTGGSGTQALTFAYTVAAGQNTARLAVTAVNANGATVTDAAGNPVSTSLAGAAVPSGALVIDTTAPVAASPALTVAQNARPTAIGLVAPSDNLSALGSLAIVAGTLPTDGTVTLADGTTPVAAGQSLTAAQLQSLAFTPTPGAFSQGSTFTYRVTDGAGNVALGTAALNVGGPGAPVITGTHASTTTSEAVVLPFSGVAIADPSAATETLSIALTGASGTLSDGAGYAGLTRNPDGSYRLTGSAAAVTAELNALSFAPAAGAAGTTSTTTFVLTDASSSGASAVDTGTSVADTDPLIVAPPTNNSPGANAPDSVSLDPAVSYSRGTFTLTGTVSSAAGVSGVEISAVLDDGSRQDLGAATLNGDGTFAFSEAFGAHQQSFIQATLTDGAGQQTVSVDPGFSLANFLEHGGFDARQTVFSADGSEITSTSLFHTDGSRKVEVSTGDQRLHSAFFDTFQNHGAPSNTFVFDAGHGLDIVNGFRVDGADHDTLSFKGSDFGNDIAAVLKSAHNAQGGVVILDPTSGDTVRLAGVTKAELKSNRSDFMFHA